jgi:sortase A
VGRQQDRPPGSRRGPQEPVEELATGGVKPGVGLVEEQQPGSAGQGGGQGGAALLAGREAPEGHAGDSAQSELLQHPFGLVCRLAGGPGPEPEVLPHAQVVVTPGGVPEEGQLPAGAVPVGGQVAAEDLTRPGAEGQEAGQQPQQGRLAGAVWPGDEHDLTLVDVQIHAGQGREAAQQADGGAEVNGERRQCDSRFDGSGDSVRRRSKQPPTAAGAAGDRRAAGTLDQMDRFRSALSGIGAVLTGTGVLILLFVAYQLWGTGLYTSRQQGDLKAQFRSGVTSTTTAPTPTPPPPPTGEAVAVIRIPKIGVDQAVVPDVGVADLRKGPGHYPQTPLPGEPGNAAIAGHRTTYGAPFNRLDELITGDDIEVTTLAGSFLYRVTELKVVSPKEISVLDPTPEPHLTLTTCNPKYSAAQRLVVVSRLAPGEKAARPTPTTTTITVPGSKKTPATLADAGLSSGRSKVSTVWWGVGTALVGIAWWVAVRRRRHWTTYVAGALPFLVVLFFFYAHLERLLPANY